VDSAATVPLPPFRVRLDPGACTLWRTRFATEAERAPVHSDIPTLIITGEYDARTPIENAQRIALTLTHAFVYELPGTGHSGMPACGQDILRQFLQNPLRQPDASCIARMPKPSFPTTWPDSTRSGFVPQPRGAGR
jgi:pimeloyl-ACP methyl ester carboxylesterase